MEIKERLQENLVMILIVGGVLLTIFGFLLFFMLSGAGVLRYLFTQGDRSNWDLAGFGLLLSLMGVVASLTGLGIGLHKAFSNDRKSPIEQLEGAYIVSKTAVTKRGQDVFDLEMLDEDELRLYVRLQHANGTVKEYQTALAVFEGIGEGLQGKATVQGKWLSQFEFQPKTAEPVQPYDA